MTTCYYCDRPKCSEEHAIAKAFFSRNTKNLIKVPSCKVHNNDKSSYDEFISTIFLSTTNCDNWNKNNFKNKYFKRVAVATISAITDFNNHTIVITPELKQICLTYFKQMSCALYYKKYNLSKKLLDVYPTYVMCVGWQIHNDTSIKDSRLINNQDLENDLQDLLRRQNFHIIAKTYDNGQFWYKILEVNDQCLFEMNFYNTIKFYIGFSKTVMPELVFILGN